MKNTVQELIRKVRKLEIKSKRMADSLFRGPYHSTFRGQGMVFREVRPYQSTDGLRFIDWHVTARMGTPYTKLFEEERERTVLLMVDASASTQFGAHQRTKQGAMQEIAAILCFAAIDNGDKAGLILFDNEPQEFLPPQKGRHQALLLLRKLVGATSTAAATDITAALQLIPKLSKHRSIVFVISDFLVKDGWQKILKQVAKRHDVIGIQVYDGLEKSLPDVGFLPIQDPETQSVRWVDTSNAGVRQQHQAEFFDRTAALAQVFKESGASLLHLQTNDDPVKVLQRYFLRKR